MRGEHYEYLVGGIGDTWIIPACAGNTDGFYYAGYVVWDHPRMRGEHTKKIA